MFDIRLINLLSFMPGISISETADTPSSLEKTLGIYVVDKLLQMIAFS